MASKWAWALVPMMALRPQNPRAPQLYVFKAERVKAVTVRGAKTSMPCLGTKCRQHRSMISGHGMMLMGMSTHPVFGFRDEGWSSGLGVWGLGP